MTGAPQRPAILVDVDGVLNPDLKCGGPPYCHCHLRWVRRFTYFGSRKIRLYLNTDHAEMLRTLARKTGAELIWATTWEDDANREIGAHIGLPQMRVAPMPVLGDPAVAALGWEEIWVRNRIGRLVVIPPEKAYGFIPWLGGRPFVWFDDMAGEKAVADRIAAQPHLMIMTQERVGLLPEHIAEANRWLSTLGTGRL